MKKYKENRELYKRIAKESPEGRARVEEIRKLKTKADESLENLFTGAVGTAVFTTMATTIYRGDFGKPDVWGYIFATMVAIFGVGSLLGGIGSFFVRKDTVSALNDAMLKLEKDNNEMTL